jgi:hypothetical protein
MTAFSFGEGSIINEMPVIKHLLGCGVTANILPLATLILKLPVISLVYLKFK